MEDNFVARNFMHFSVKKEYDDKKIVAYTPQQNYITEKANRTLVKKKKRAMFLAALPKGPTKR